MDLVEGLDVDKLEDEVSMDYVEETERVEEEEKIVEAFDKVGGSRDFLSISKTGFGPLMEAMGTAYF